MERMKFEIEGEIEHNDEEVIESEKEEEEVTENGNKGIVFLLFLFVFLFLVSASAFVYFQFYQGNGKWEWSLQRHNSEKNDLTKVLSENKKLSAIIDSITQVQLKSNYSDTGTYQPIFTNDMSGDKYEVQIGFFKSFDFSVYNESLVNMNVENSNGSVKLLIGRFNTFEEACKFRQDIIDLGIKGAFVAKKTNGKRVPFDGQCP